MENKQKKIAGGFAAVAALAMAALIPSLQSHEGLSLEAYQDVAGVFTVCYGKAYVKPGTRKTQYECDAMLQSDAYAYMRPVYDAMKYQPDPLVLAAHTSFAYNIGIAAYKRSQTLAKTNSGDVVGGCKAMMNWYTSGGKDCRIKANKCGGLITRRTDEVNLCLLGAQRE